MRLLVVEDEEKLAQALKKGLEKEGYAADLVADGETAQRRIELYNKEYDLVILDLMLPKRDGFTVCKNVREQGIVIPILILTARNGLDDKVTVLNSGADDYLAKPFSLKELVARIRALLRRPHETITAVMSVGDLSLDTTTRSVKRDGKEIQLTVKEFALLEYLMRHPNQVLSRDQILDHLWGFDFDTFSNVVDVHLKNLRKKIELSPNDEKILETIRGVGYRIRA